MTNHLNLKKTLFEFDDQGNLTIFSRGKSVQVPLIEVWQMLKWLERDQKERLRLLVEQTILPQQEDSAP